MKVKILRTGPRGPYRTEMAATHSIGSEEYLHPDGTVTITLTGAPGCFTFFVEGAVEEIPRKEYPSSLTWDSIIVRPTAAAKAEGSGIGYIYAVSVHDFRRRDPYVKVKITVREREW